MKELTFVGKVLALLTPQEKRRGVLVLGMMFLLAVLETAGVASIMPFLAVLGNPELVETNAALGWMYERGGFDTVDAFLFALGLGACLLVVLSTGVRILNTYAVNRYVLMREYSISARLLQTYLRQPYEFFLTRNSADLSKSVLSEVRQVINLALRPGMELISYGLVAAALVALLVAMDPVVAASVGLLFGLLYGAIYLTIRGFLRRMGAKRVSANRARYQMAAEAFGGIKDLKVLGRDQAYLKRFRRPAAEFARYEYLKATLVTTPRYLIETIAFGGVLALALFLMATRESLGAVLPLLGLYAFAGYRLLPAVQHIFSSAASLRFGGPAVDPIYEDLIESPPEVSEAAKGRDFTLSEGIRFSGVSFRYPGADGDALRRVDLMIPARTSVGFVGQTGAGKTTAVDLILGLLQPTQGTILVDGRPMDQVGMRAWQRALGYVPQDIYLADGSVAENIAFGIEKERIDPAAVERAARAARIHEFVTEALPQGYGTEVGERGVRLSGGQRQRIGIARALYHDPEVLVLDEATSAVDTATERAIMDAVEGLAGQKTLIMIAHRLSTVERCGQIVVLDHGEVVGIGSFEELRSSNETFRKLAVA